MNPAMTSILAAQTIDEILDLRPDDIAGVMSQEEVTHILRLADCFWMHSGNPEDPHAILTSGKCSDGFVNVLPALSYTPICNLFGAMIARQIEQSYPNLHGRDVWVIGSAYAAIDLSKSVADCLGARHGCGEKDGDAQRWQRLEIRPEDTVIQVEELMTTLKTLVAVRNGIIAGNSTPVRFAPFVATLVHRSPIEEFEGQPIFRLAHYDIETWEPEDCPLCKQGSERLKPKVPAENWQRLTGARR